MRGAQIISMTHAMITERVPMFIFGCLYPIDFIILQSERGQRRITEKLLPSIQGFFEVNNKKEQSHQEREELKQAGLGKPRL